MQGSTDAGTQAISRALEMLERLAQSDGPLDIAAVAASIGIAPSSAHRLIAVLVSRGFLSRIGRGDYMAGPALIRVGTRAGLHARIRRAARPPMRRLALTAGSAVHLGVWEGEMVRYLVKEAPTGTCLFTREDMLLEGYCSGIGKVLLAHLPAQERDAYLAGNQLFVALTSRTLTDAGEIRASLELAAKRGWAVDDGEVLEGLTCLAVPIEVPGEGVVAALSLARLNATPGQQPFLGRLRSVAATIALRLQSAGLGERQAFAQKSPNE